MTDTRVTERNWLKIEPKSLTSDGTVGGLVTLDKKAICLFRVKMVVVLEATGEPPLRVEVKRVVSDTQMIVGPERSRTNPPPKNRPLVDDFIDISAYTTAKGSTIRAYDQKRTGVPVDQIERFVYEEEPVMAYREFLVDCFGRPIDSVVDTNGVNRLAVDTSLSVDNVNVDIQNPTACSIINHTVVTEDEEFVLSLPNNTKRYTISVRDCAIMRVACGVGKTATEYIEVPMGGQYSSGDVDMPDSSSVYLQVDTAGAIVQVESWYTT